jgi:hypothetical protein
MPREGVAVAALMLGILSSSGATAQPSSVDTALAIQLYDEAQKLMAAGNPAAACPKYAESQKRDPQLGTLLHLADCHEKVGKTASAWAGYKEAAEIAARRNAAGGNERREQVARARAAALEPKLSTVVIHVAQADMAGLEVRRDGELLGRAVWGSAMPLDPGSYTFAAQAPGKKAWTQTVEVRPGGAKTVVTVPALEDEGFTARRPVGSSSLPGSVAGIAPPTADEHGRGNTQRTAGYILAGLGVVGAGVGTVFGLQVLSNIKERDDIICPDNWCTPEQGARIRVLEAEAGTNRTASYVTFALGGAAALGGIALVLTAPSREARMVTGLNVVPWAGPNSAGAHVTGRW